MSPSIIEEFQQRRETQNQTVLQYANQDIKRFFHLDHSVYRQNALPAKSKEMLGLVASLVLRCDDCISYHLQRCQAEDVTNEELIEVLSIGLVVGGSITIPHLRRALAFWQELNANAASTESDSAQPVP